MKIKRIREFNGDATNTTETHITYTPCYVMCDLLTTKLQSENESKILKEKEGGNFKS